MRKQLRYLVVALTIVGALTLTGCHSGAAKGQAAQDTTNEMHLAGVSRTPHEGFELICIQDKAMTQSAKLFKDADAKLLKQMLPNGEAESSDNVFLVANDQRYILFDAGIGEEQGGTLLKKLKMLHVNPEEVSAVVLTHFHPDHIGGLIYNNGPAFPNADIYASVAEYNAWTNGSLKKDNKQVMAMLACYAPHLQLFQDGDTILGNIVAHYAAGHTPGHTVYEIGDVLITGDLIHAKALQVEHPEISSVYDQYPQQAAQQRQKWLQYAKQNGKVFAGMHLPLPGTL